MRARSTVTAMSAAHTSAYPEASASPLTAAMTGLPSLGKIRSRSTSA